MDLDSLHPVVTRLVARPETGASAQLEFRHLILFAMSKKPIQKSTINRLNYENQGNIIPGFMRPSLHEVPSLTRFPGISVTIQIFLARLQGHLLDKYVLNSLNCPVKIPIGPACNHQFSFGTVRFSTSGVYVFNIRERLTTVTELSAMANAASSGLNMMPNEG